ncbi:YfcC family protein [Yinghuangia aomiensis]
MSSEHACRFPGAQGGHDGEPPEKDDTGKKDEGKRGFRCPSALTVLAIVTVAVWALSSAIPSGEYQRGEDSKPVQGSFTTTPSPEDFIRQTACSLSPVNGLYGIRDADTGQVAPDNAGDLYGAAGVFLFVIAIGAFITVGVRHCRRPGPRYRPARYTRLRTRGAVLIIAVMTVFSVLGSVEGFAEETLGFYGLIIPLMLALGYDRMVATGTIILGAGVGVMCSTVNPFATGVASSAADISLGDGIVLRVVMLVVLTAVTIAYVVRYAVRVKADPSRSLVGFLPGDREQAAEAATTEPEELTRTHKIVLVAVTLTFAFMIFAIIPWAQVLTGDANAVAYVWELDWSFAELSALFIVAAVLVGLLAGLGEEKLSSTLIQGAGDFISPALIIMLARGVTVIMNNAKVTDTVLHSMEGAVSGTSSAVFGIMIFVVNLPLAFLIPSTSGHATLAMPILAPLADFADVPRALVVTAWQAASGWMNLWVPTTAVIMGGIALAKVGYNQYLRFVFPLLVILFVLICGFVAIGSSLS